MVSCFGVHPLWPTIPCLTPCPSAWWWLLLQARWQVLLCSLSASWLPSSLAGVSRAAPSKEQGDLLNLESKIKEQCDSPVSDVQISNEEMLPSKCSTEHRKP